MLYIIYLYIEFHKIKLVRRMKFCRLFFYAELKTLKAYKAIYIFTNLFLDIRKIGLLSEYCIKSL